MAKVTPSKTRRPKGSGTVRASAEDGGFSEGVTEVSAAGAPPVPPVQSVGQVLDHVNEVRLIGRLAVEPLRRELPSGDVLMSFRLVVTRAAPRPARDKRGPTVDTLDCAAWRRDVQRSLGRLQPGDVVQVEGSLRRRFWRAGAAAVSRSEVEVERISRVAKAS